MEFFIPGLFLFLVTLFITFHLAPKATPFMASILSIIFLSYGVYHHQKLFAAEYRLSTWQDGLKIYAPAIMILAIVIYIIYGILAFFTGGKVPIPSVLNVSLPSANSMKNSITNSMESLGNTVTNSLNNMASFNNGNKKGNNGSLLENLGNSLGMNQNKNKKNNTSRSFLETV
jgi:hypothetical protein